MFEVLLKTNLNKINDKFNAYKLMAGIKYNKKDNSAEKIMFIIDNGVAKDVFNEDIYSLDDTDNIYVADYISLFEVIRDFFNKDEINMAEVYMVYKMFINDMKFINRNLEYFGFDKVDVGYKQKIEYREDLHNQDKLDMYYALSNIINCHKRVYEKKY